MIGEGVVDRMACDQKISPPRKVDLYSEGEQGA